MLRPQHAQGLEEKVSELGAKVDRVAVQVSELVVQGKQVEDSVEGMRGELLLHTGSIQALVHSFRSRERKEQCATILGFVITALLFWIVYLL